jgi:hypothetical protein
MENRLDFFRQQMAAFEGAADPRDAIRRGFYTEEPEHSSTNKLFKRICLKSNSRNLMIGGIGSGKTTQLFRIENLLKATDIYPHYIDITQYEQAENIQSGSLRAIVGLEILDILNRTDIDLDKKKVEAIHEYAYGRTTEILEDNLSDLIGKRMNSLERKTRIVHRPGILSPNQTSQDDRANKSLRWILNEFEDHFSKKIFLLFDGLDRLDNVEAFMKAARSNLEDLDIGFLLIGPVNLLYSKFADSLDNHFNYIEHRTAFDIRDDLESYEFFKKIITSRSIKDFLQEKALEDLINSSGGVLRDLINLTQESIQEAYLSDAETVEQSHVGIAVRSLGRSKFLGLDSPEVKFLDRMARAEIPIAPKELEEVALLAQGRFLEYKYPKRRFAAHPALKELILSGTLV